MAGGAPFSDPFIERRGCGPTQEGHLTQHGRLRGLSFEFHLFPRQHFSLVQLTQPSFSQFTHPWLTAAWPRAGLGTTKGLHRSVHWILTATLQAQFSGYSHPIDEDAATLGAPSKCRRLRFNPWVGRISWRRKWQPMPVFLPGKPHGERSLAGYSPGGHRRAGHDWMNDHASTDKHTEPWDV